MDPPADSGAALPAGADRAEPTDYDGAWKELHALFWREMLELLDPELYGLLLPGGVPISRTTELRQLGPRSLRGPDHCDELQEVRLAEAPAEPVLLHTELQAQYQPGRTFPERMARYARLIEVHFDSRVIGLAILTDPNRRWRPDRSIWQLAGCRSEWRYRVVKVQDWEPRRAELEESANPVAAFVLAHLEAQRTHGKEAAREAARWERTLHVYQGGWEPEVGRNLLRLVNWILPLSLAGEERFAERLRRFEEGQSVPYVMPIVQFAREEGRTEGRAEGRVEGWTVGAREKLQGFIAEILQRRFQASPEEWQRHVAGIHDIAELNRLQELAWDAPSLEEFRKGFPDGSSNGHAAETG